MQTLSNNLTYEYNARRKNKHIAVCSVYLQLAWVSLLLYMLILKSSIFTYAVLNSIQSNNVHVLLNVTYTKHIPALFY